MLLFNFNVSYKGNQKYEILLSDKKGTDNIHASF